MSSPRLTGEDHIDRDIESLSVSKRLVRSMSKKFKRKNQKIKVHEKDEVSGMSLRCLSLYGRGGGCKVGADTGEYYGDSGSRRRSSANEEGKGYTRMCETEESTVDCFAYGMKEKSWILRQRLNLLLSLLFSCQHGNCANKVQVKVFQSASNMSASETKTALTELSDILVLTLACVEKLFAEWDT